MINTRYKTLLIILTILVVGVAIGALGSAAFRRSIQEKHRRLPPEEHFTEVMRSIIRPTAEQQEDIDATIEKRSAQIAELKERFENEIFAVFDTMRTELSEILTPEQRQRLERELLRGPRKRLDRRVNQLARELSLTKTQRDTIHKMLSKNFSLHFGDRRPDFGGRARPFGFRAMQKQIEEVLTPEQRLKFRELQESHKPFEQPRRDIRPFGKRPPRRRAPEDFHD